MALETWALLTMDEAKEYLEIGDASKDAILSAAVNAATLAVEGYTQRLLKSRTYTNEVYNGTGTMFLKVRQYPATSVSAVGFYNDGWEAQDLSAYPVAIEEPIKDRIYFRDLLFPYGRQNVRTTYVAGLSTVGEDLKFGTRLVLMHQWKAKEMVLAGIASQSFPGGQSVTYRNDEIPVQAIPFLRPYMRAAA